VCSSDLVSHKLRTPLTSIRGALGLVLGTMTGAMPERAVHLVDIAHKNSERLIPLVNDILDLDKIDAGMVRVDLADADAVDLVRQAIDATRSFCDRFGVTVVLDAPKIRVGVRVDEGRFLQVVTNLLSNAAKFSPRDSVVEVAVTIVEGRVRLAVRDHGPGIPDEFRAKIFGRFAQADSATTRAKGGSGLGLHICRQLVSLMGGTIGFDSAVGVGSTFWVEFPFADRDAGPADIMWADAPTEIGAPARRRVTVLAEEGPMSDFLFTAIDEAGAEAITEVAPETVAVVVDVAVADTPAAAALRADLAQCGDAPPPVFLVAAETGDVEAAAAIRDIWSARDIWTIEAAAPRKIVARIAAATGTTPRGLPRILHVEDDRDLAAVVAAGLSGSANVTCVARVSQALRQLEAARFDLVVIDPALPDGDGITRLVPRLVKKSIPYMILSAEERADAAGTAVAALVKSRIDERQLVDTILSILSQRRRRPEEARHAG
jgi:CheY-like chemotaxis protein